MTTKRKGLEDSEEMWSMLQMVMRELKEIENESIETIRVIKDGAWRNALKYGFGSDFWCQGEVIVDPVQDDAGEDLMNPVDVDMASFRVTLIQLDQK